MRELLVTVLPSILIITLIITLVINVFMPQLSIEQIRVVTRIKQASVAARKPQTTHSTLSYYLPL